MLIKMPAFFRGAATVLMTGLLLAVGATRLQAVSCSTQAEMSEAQRNGLQEAARSLGDLIVSANIPALQARTIPSVANSFDGIAGTVKGLTAQLSGASLRVASLYLLDAADAPAGQEETQFFCGQAANAAHVAFAIPQLPPGRYAFAIVEATGVKEAQRLSMLLQNVSGNGVAASWQLAGFFPRPLLFAGHAGVWYWQKARNYARAGEKWNSYFYYETAQFLLLPADFLSSSNLEKLGQEATTSTPSGLPGQEPMLVNSSGTTLRVTNLHTDASFGGLDLVINYEAADVSDPVQARRVTVGLMKSMLLLHPELRSGFHGLWVFANAPNQRPFSLELPMAEIESQS